MSEEDKLFDQLFEQGEELTDKQKKIIVAAIESFAEKGYASTSTSEIAKKAGVAEGTIFRHYKTKKDLLYSIIAPMMAKLIGPFVVKDLNKVLNHEYNQFEDFLRAMIENRIDFLQKNMLLFKILIQEIPFQPELRDQFKKHIAFKVYERFKQIVKHYQEKGQIIDLPPEQIIRLVVSNIAGYLFARNLIFPERDWNDEEEIDLTIQFIMKGLSPHK